MELLTHINTKEVMKYLSLRHGIPEKEYVEKIDEMSHSVMKASKEKVCSVTFKITNHDPVELENGAVRLEGEDIKNHLIDCDECVFLAATLGSDIDRLIKKSSLQDMAEAVIIDACASAAIENVCENYTAEIERMAAEKGLYITDRFSPGYGDMPIESQRMFCDVTSCDRRIGLFCSRDMILTPLKSVTAVIGISRLPQPKRKSGCEICERFYDCQFRKIGEVCYG